LNLTAAAQHSGVPEAWITAITGLLSVILGFLIAASLR
jgi:hypothetical protein